MADDGLILGIDLGTTYSAMAYVDKHGKPSIIPNAEGQRTTASVLHFYDEDGCVVGDEALKMLVVDTQNLVRFIKRRMGDPDFKLRFYGRSYSAQELSALILKKLKADAEDVLGVEIKDAVITVPAYFSSPQRGATAEAGALAGFNVLSIINEPTAAAIAYGVERVGGNRNLLVFDLGGGTFDVTVMEIRGSHLRTIATGGNAELGGKDWDDRLLDHVARQFIERHGRDPRDDAQVSQELYERCLHAKIALSTKPRAVVPVNFQGNRANIAVTVEEFEALTVDLVEQCAETCSYVLEQAQLTWAEIDDVLLAGGSTRMPMIPAMLQRLSGKLAVTGVNPDECVAIGASLAAVFRHRSEHPAIQAYRRAARERSDTTKSDKGARAKPAPGTLREVQFTDVATHALGMVVLDANMRERVVPLIAQFSPLPCERIGRYAYAYDNMTAVRVEVTEGAGTARDEIQVIGEVVLDNLPPRARGTLIEVIYRYNVNNLLEVDVIDTETGRSNKAEFHLRGTLDAGQAGDARRNVAAAVVA